MQRAMIIIDDCNNGWAVTNVFKMVDIILLLKAISVVVVPWQHKVCIYDTYIATGHLGVVTLCNL